MKVKVKLKPLEQVIKEFEFEKDELWYIKRINYKGESIIWCIMEYMFKYFGKELELQKLQEVPDKKDFYTHYIDDSTTDLRWFFHESWFDMEDFITEEEFML